MAASLYLASTSRYRAELLARLHIPFLIEAPDIDESAVAGERPEARALRLARAKAAAVADRHSGSWTNPAMPNDAATTSPRAADDRWIFIRQSCCCGVERTSLQSTSTGPSSGFANSRRMRLRITLRLIGLSIAPGAFAAKVSVWPCCSPSKRGTRRR